MSLFLLPPLPPLSLEFGREGSTTGSPPIQEGSYADPALACGGGVRGGGNNDCKSGVSRQGKKKGATNWQPLK